MQLWPELVAIDTLTFFLAKTQNCCVVERLQSEKTTSKTPTSEKSYFENESSHSQSIECENVSSESATVVCYVVCDID